MEWCRVTPAACEVEVDVTQFDFCVFEYALLKPSISLHSSELRPAECSGFFCDLGLVVFFLVFARTLTLLKCSRSVLCMSYYSRMHPGAVISSGNPPTIWKIQHMHMDILIKEKNLIFFTV